MIELYECQLCGSLNEPDTQCPCGGAPGRAKRQSYRARRKHGGTVRWFECECSHVSTRPVHCGYSEVRRGTQGDYRRALLQARDGPGCQNCGSLDNLTIDHKKPRSRGGSNKLHNLWVLCQSCNGEKADMTVAEWRAWQAEVLDEAVAQRLGFPGMSEPLAPKEVVDMHTRSKIELSWIEHDLRVAQERRGLLIETKELLEDLIPVSDGGEDRP